MSDPSNTPRPSHAPFDSQFEKEESRVRTKADDERATSRSGSYEAVTPGRTAGGQGLARETVAERMERIEHKMTVATLILRRLSPTDTRARLLSSAIFRHDEVLLDAVLSEMTEELVGLASDRGDSRRNP